MRQHGLGLSGTLPCPPQPKTRITGFARTAQRSGTPTTASDAMGPARCGGERRGTEDYLCWRSNKKLGPLPRFCLPTVPLIYPCRNGSGTCQPFDVLTWTSLLLGCPSWTLQPAGRLLKPSLQVGSQTSGLLWATQESFTKRK